MSKALVSIIFQGPPIRHEYYRLTWELMKLSLLKVKDQVDKIYIVCNSFNPTVEDLEWLRINYPHKAVLMLGNMESHWEMMSMICKQVTEDWVLLMDSDTVIYDPWDMYGRFQFLHETDIAASLDGSGEDLGFSVMGDNRRIAPYWCFIKMDLLRKTTMDFYPDATHDSMGLLTKELLEKGARIMQLGDDRSSFYPDETLMHSGLEDGHYHLRNWNGALHILTSYLDDSESYNRDVKLMPLNERARLLAWVWIVNDLTIKNEGISKAVQDIFEDWGLYKWKDYVAQFRKFHTWIDKFLT